MNEEYLFIFLFFLGFANKYDLDLTPPADWTDSESKFIWDDYLAVHNNIQVAPEILFSTHENLEGFEQGMMLEAPDPSNPNVICAASIAKARYPFFFYSISKHYIESFSFWSIF